MNENQIFLCSIALFATGLLALIFKKNGIVQLMGIELMLNAANINFVSFNKSSDNAAIPLLIIAFAVAESALALAILYKLYKK
jgi:NADH-quinone oxidoreductase subunit K